MKAWVYRHYGSPEVLKLEDIDAPTPKGDEVSVRVQAAGLNAADWHIMRADPFLARIAVGLGKPRKRMIIGSDLAGIVETVGSNVTRLAVGDKVYAESMMKGGCADVIALHEDHVAPMPKTATFEQAAAVPMAATTALAAVRDDGGVQPGQSVLVIGASGGVGTFAVQIARGLGGKVTAVCRTEAIDLVRSLGADEVIDYTREDPTATGLSYDVIINIGGTHSLKALRRTLTPKGTLAGVGGSQHGGLLGPGSVGTRGAMLSPFVSQQLKSVGRKGNFTDLDTIADMIDSGDLRPVIDRVFPFDATPDALRYVEDAHPKGKVIVRVGSDASS